MKDVRAIVSQAKRDNNGLGWLLTASGTKHTDFSDFRKCCNFLQRHRLCADPSIFVQLPSSRVCSPHPWRPRLP